MSVLPEREECEEGAVCVGLGKGETVVGGNQNATGKISDAGWSCVMESSAEFRTVIRLINSMTAWEPGVRRSYSACHCGRGGPGKSYVDIWVASTSNKRMKKHNDTPFC